MEDDDYVPNKRPGDAFNNKPVADDDDEEEYYESKKVGGNKDRSLGRMLEPPIAKESEDAERIAHLVNKAELIKEERSTDRGRERDN